MYNYAKSLMEFLIEANISNIKYYHVFNTNDHKTYQFYLIIPEHNMLPMLRINLMGDETNPTFFKIEDLHMLAKTYHLNMLDLIHWLEDTVSIKYAYIKMLELKVHNLLGEEKCEQILENQKDFFDSLAAIFDDTQREARKAKLTLLNSDTIIEK